MPDNLLTPVGIYIHIPFCRSKCSYCDFHSLTRIDLADRYIEALASETAERVDPSGYYPTIYIGGGTPSALSAPQLRRIFEFIPWERAGEVTLEVNPDDVTSEFASLIADLPVNRISMGIQSLVNSELAVCRRRHNAAEAVNAVRLLRSAGIKNLSLDLIYGLPGQTPDSWSYSLNSLLDLAPQHLSAYMLSIETGTRFAAMLQAGKITEMADETAIDMYEQLCNATRCCGMEHYEISNFALPGFRSRHNSSYWDGTPYIGLGTGAHSFVNGVRGFNPPDIRRYIARSGRQFFLIEEETVENRFNDVIITRLRTAEGLSLTELRSRFPHSLYSEMMRQAQPHIAQGRLILTDDTLRFPEEAWMVSDAVLVDLISQ